MVDSKAVTLISGMVVATEVQEGKRNIIDFFCVIATAPARKVKGVVTIGGNGKV